MKIILLGAPGAGKGTQAKQLAEKLGLAHVSTGDLLRQNVSKGTDLGMRAKDFMNKGGLVPDELVTEMLVKRLDEPDLGKGFILDGYPRTIAQAQSLDAVFTKKNQEVDFVFYLEVSESVIIQRLCGRLVCKSCGMNYHRTNMPPAKDMVCDKCGGQLYQRADDQEETIKNRIKVYNNEVSSLINYYKAKDKLITVSADGQASIVLNKIIEIVKTNDPSKV